MEDRPTPMDPVQAEREFAQLLEEAGLPRFATAFHDPELNELQLTWDHGLTIDIDLTQPGTPPIEDWERAAILGECCADHEPIDVIVPGSADDPRVDTSIPGVVIHRQ